MIPRLTGNLMLMLALSWLIIISGNAYEKNMTLAINDSVAQNMYFYCDETGGLMDNYGAKTNAIEIEADGPIKYNNTTINASVITVEADFEQKKIYLRESSDRNHSKAFASEPINNNTVLLFEADNLSVMEGCKYTKALAIIVDSGTKTIFFLQMTENDLAMLRKAEKIEVYVESAVWEKPSQSFLS